MTKVDEVTNKPLTGPKLRFSYLNKTQDIITDANGLATIQNIPEGTKVTVTEVTASNGYFNKGELKTFILEPNKTVKVKFDNKLQ
ncbi:SpaA isopeptide-forming pilin-related protein [Mycoplasma sp. P36-A1]|uniref:SpaA isopeptide-forming pilin-related protein n=1 Tax=Mycoplasma sp. P36-A1 TaxID=3252900 RepID=UPI003C306E6D